MSFTRKHLSLVAATAIFGSAFGLAAQETSSPTGNAVSTTMNLPRSGSYEIEPTHSRLNWATSHFGYSTYTGGFDKADAQLTLDSANPENSKLVMTIDVSSVDSNSEALDEHLLSADFFDATLYPTALFRSTKVIHTSPATATIEGSLTLHGVTRIVSFDVQFNKADVNPVSKTYTVGFTATGIVKRTDFGIDTYAPAIGDDVALTFNGEFVPA